MGLSDIYIAMVYAAFFVVGRVHRFGEGVGHAQGSAAHAPRGLELERVVFRFVDRVHILNT